MVIEIKEHDGGMTATFSGRLDTPAAVKAQQEIGPLLEQQHKRCDGINCRPVVHLCDRTNKSVP